MVAHSGPNPQLELLRLCRSQPNLKERLLWLCAAHNCSSVLLHPRKSGVCARGHGDQFLVKNFASVLHYPPYSTNPFLSFDFTTSPICLSYSQNRHRESNLHDVCTLLRCCTWMVFHCVVLSSNWPKLLNTHFYFQL